MKQRVPLLVSSALALVVLLIYGIYAKWVGLNFAIDPTQLMSVLSPLVLAAGFIERAVEVLVSPWRDAEANKLQSALDALKAVDPPVPSDISTATDKLHDYRGQTQTYAFCTSLLLGIAVSSVGVRVLWPLLTAAKLNGVPSTQQTAFHLVDVVLSAALLAGGADGIHSVVTVFTTYFDASGEKMRKSAAS